MLKIEDITTLDEAVVYLSHLSKFGETLSIDDIHLSQKKDKGGYKDSYLNYAKMITDKFDDAYILLAPLLIMNPNGAELEKKLKPIMALKNSIKLERTFEDNEVPEQTVYVAFYLLKNYVFPDLYLGFNGGVR